MNAPATQVLIRPRGSPARTGPLARSFEQRRLRLYAVQMMVDVASILCGFLLVGWLVVGKFPAEVPYVQAQLLLPVYLTIAELLRV